MFGKRAIPLALGLIVALVASVARADEADPREKLDTAIPEAIRLLEAKDYATLLKEFVLPDDFKKITANVKLEDFAKQFGEDKAADALKALKSLKDKKPEMSADGTKATFKLDDPQSKPMVWMKVDKYWYIAD